MSTKSQSRDPQTPPVQNALTRRRVFAGAGAVGALAAVAAVVPLSPKPVAQVAVADQGVPQPADGYQETAHVLRYYQTARV